MVTNPKMATSDAQSANGGQTESNGGKFTAVNGGGGKDSSTPGTTNGQPRRGSEDRPNGQPRITPPGQEKLTITTTNTPREDWPPATNGDRPTNGSGPQYPQSSINYPDPFENPHKRKRSASDERQSSTSSYHSHGLPKNSPVTAHPDSGLGAEMIDTPRDGPSRNGTEGRDHFGQHTQYGDEVRDVVAGNPWYPQPSQEPRSAFDSNLNTLHSEEQQLRENLQREIQRDSQQPSNGNIYGGGHYSPGDDEDRNSATYESYPQDRTQMTSVQIQADMKKRKRNFSNRTKTGCMTCRRRKKKCDEQRPECKFLVLKFHNVYSNKVGNNCMRGGFVCQGYPARGSWPKPAEKQGPVPLQSKDGYESNQSPYSYSPQHSLPATQPRRDPLPGYRGQPLRVDPQQGPRTNGMDDDRPSASTLPSALTTSPDHRMSAISSYQQSAFPTPISAQSAYPHDRLTKQEYGRSSQHDNHQDQLQTPQSAVTPHSNMLHAAQSQIALQALNHPASHTASQQQPLSQKEKMLSGSQYFPFDKELVLERERCNGACWRFNNSTNPNNGVSPEERSRLFRDIIQPLTPLSISPTSSNNTLSPLPIGSIGENVVVEAPFNCDYGYNISIGKDVSIGKNCTIMDSCKLVIGDRCVIGPNVNLYTTEVPVDPRRRMGNRGPQVGKGVVIEEDCWIAGGVTVLPGITIKRGSTVGAGSVVTRVRFIFFFLFHIHASSVVLPTELPEKNAWLLEGFITNKTTNRMCRLTQS